MYKEYHCPGTPSSSPELFSNYHWEKLTDDKIRANRDKSLLCRSQSIPEFLFYPSGIRRTICPIRQFKTTKESKATPVPSASAH